MMRVAIIGAGIVGVATAYECAADGHEVTVYDRRPAVAVECSFAPAGLIAPGHLERWAMPAMRRRVLQQLSGRHAWPHLTWMWRWWRACAAAPSGAGHRALLALARHSQSRHETLSSTLQLEHEQSRGCLVLLRSARDVARTRAGLDLLTEAGVPFAWLDAAQARSIEPGLSVELPLAAALHLPDALAGNARQLAQALRQRSLALGVQWRLDHEVTGLQPGTPATLRWRRRTPAEGLPLDGSAEVDAVVVCAGVEANTVLTQVGVRLPLVPVRGSSITAPLRHDEARAVGPSSVLVDEHHRVTLWRLGQRVRAAGGHVLGGPLDQPLPRALATLYRVLDDCFPGAAQLREAQLWTGARPMLPDGMPVIGASGAAGIWLNTGHGSSGCALAAGSARALADGLSGRDAAVALAPFGVDRLSR